MIEFLKSKRIFLMIGFAWVILWVVPWGNALSFEGNLYLIFFVDMFKLGVALGMFMLPGYLLYILLREESDPLFDLTGLLPIGFALSVTIIAVIGIFGRLFGVSFVVVKDVFMLVGLCELVFLMVIKPSFMVRKEDVLESLRSLLNNPPLLLALVLAVLMVFNDYLFFIDDTTYLAYMTSWQRATELGFNNIIHQSNITEIERFWLALYPMGQALLSDLSGVPGILLLSNYLELFLVPFAVITSYWFARTLGLSKRAAGFSVLIQISLYTWMVGPEWPVGTWFYQSMAEDKVSAVFLLAPGFFAFVLRFIQIPARNNIVLSFLSGISLTFTHPVILFFTCIIVAGLVIFSWVSKRVGWREVIQLVVVLVSLVAPYVIIRFYNYSGSAGFALDAKSASISFQIDRYTNVVNDVFYGLNPGVLQFFDLPLESSVYNTFQFIRPFPFILVLIVGVVAFFRIRQGPIYWYVLSCVLLVVLATLPYTGWILGYFTDARLISRASWFSPLGLAGSLVLMSAADSLKKNRDINKIERNHAFGTLAGLVVCFVFVTPMLVFGSMSRIPFYFEVLDHHRQLAKMGAYVDRNTTSPVTVIALDYTDIQLLPGVSAHTSLISFREEKDDNGHNFTFSPDEIHQRIYASNTIRSLKEGISNQERCGLIEKYGVKFVIAQTNDVNLYTSVAGNCRNGLEVMYVTKDMSLLEFK